VKVVVVSRATGHFSVVVAFEFPYYAANLSLVVDFITESAICVVRSHDAGVGMINAGEGESWRGCREEENQEEEEVAKGKGGHLECGASKDGGTGVA
jgi:hypothetical protein